MCAVIIRGLVHQVIHDKVHGYDQWGFYTYDDLFQTGCIGLCKAAATDKGGIMCMGVKGTKVLKEPSGDGNGCRILFLKLFLK